MHKKGRWDEEHQMIKNNSVMLEYGGKEEIKECDYRIQITTIMVVEM